MSSPFESHYVPTPVEEWAKTAPVKTIPQLFRRPIKEQNAGNRRFLGAKIDGVYQDLEEEYCSIYSINVNQLLSEDLACDDPRP